MASESALVNAATTALPLLYTTLRTTDGKPLLGLAHQARLEAGCRELRWPSPPRADSWLPLTENLAAQSGGDIRARLTLWLDGNALQGRLECAPLQLPAQIRLWPAPPGSARSRAGLKLHNPALREWEAQAAGFGAQEAILRRGDGIITETTRSNLLWSDAAGRIYHPRGPALPGVMLGWVLAELRASGREISAVDAQLQELDSATELFVTSSVKGPLSAVLPARNGGAGALPNPAGESGPVGKYLAQRYARLLARTAAGESICTP